MKVSDNPDVQNHYELCLANGCSERLAEMFALGQTPALSTDSTFLEGMSTNGSQFGGQEHIGDYYRQMANAVGIDTKGKVYLSGLALHPGDPQAWVTGKGDVKRVCEERGWGCNGAIKIKAQEPVAEHKSVEIDERLVQEEVKQIFETVGPDAGRPADVADKVRSKRKRGGK